MNLSVIILNFSRPGYVKNKSIPHMKKIVDEIIISHGKKEVYFKQKDIISIDHSKENDIYGLSLRFLTANNAKNDFVMIMDDDILPDKKSVEFLYNKINSEPDRIHGIYGRDIRKGYSVDNCFGEVPVVLTRCLVTTKDMCQYFIDNFRDYETDLIKNSKPYWNGEDILFSLLSIKRYGKLPISYDLSHINRWENYLDFSGSISLTSSHINYRKDITREFVEKLNLQGVISKKTNIKFKKEDISYFIKNSNLLYPLIIVVIFLTYYIIKKLFI